MDAGQLDRVISLTRIVMTPRPDEPWVRDPVPTKYATIRAQIVQQSTEEFMRTFGEGQETAIVFRIRYRSDVVLTDQVAYGGKAFDLLEIKEIGLREGLELRTKALGP